MPDCAWGVRAPCRRTALCGAHGPQRCSAALRNLSALRNADLSGPNCSAGVAARFISLCCVLSFRCFQRLKACSFITEFLPAFPPSSSLFLCLSMLQKEALCTFPQLRNLWVSVQMKRGTENEMILLCVAVVLARRWELHGLGCADQRAAHCSTWHPHCHSLLILFFPSVDL